ncbi:MAG: S8 family serine peptidase [Oscillospiraceae bacterium]|nr:S8 family serine peptidase [Oscillospiraceae bacterium]
MKIKQFIRKTFIVMIASIIFMSYDYKGYSIKYAAQDETNNVLTTITKDEFTEFPVNIMDENVKVFSEFDRNGNNNDLLIDGDTIIVVFKKEYSEINKIWKPSDFNFSNIKSVVDISNINFSKNEMADYLSNVTYRQIIQVNLNKSGKKEINDAMAYFSSRNDVKKVFPNIFNKRNISNDNLKEKNINTAIPNDPLIPPNYWALANTQVYDAWNEYTTGDASVKIGVIDTGVNNDVDLLPNIEVGYNASNDSTITHNNKSTHGTAVAGVIGAKGNNGVGGAGVCWDIGLIPLKDEDDNGYNQLIYTIKCINYAINNNIPILNMSFYFFGNVLDEAMSNYPGLVVCGSGNDHWDITDINLSPASSSLNNVITVGSCDSTDSLTNSSNYGRNVDLVAPGTYITAYGDGSYGEVMGTSIASPFVAGVAGLILSKYPEITPLQVKEAILKSVDKIDSLSDKVFTGGRINAYKSLKYVENSKYMQIAFQVNLRSNPKSEFVHAIGYESSKVNYHKFIPWNKNINEDSVSIANFTNDQINIYYEGDVLAQNTKLYTILFDVNMNNYNNNVKPLDLFEFITFCTYSDTYSAVLGDVNNDGEINSLDLNLIQQYTVNSFLPSNNQKVAMDVNLDGKIDVFDIITINKYINKMILQF